MPQETRPPRCDEPNKKPGSDKDRASGTATRPADGWAGGWFCRAALTKLQRSVSSKARSPGTLGMCRPGLPPSAQRPSQLRQAGSLADATNLLAVSMFQKRAPGSREKPGFPRLADESRQNELPQFTNCQPTYGARGHGTSGYGLAGERHQA
jgi:hypothetical protein